MAWLGLVANLWPNDPLYSMVLMVGKQPLVPMVFEETTIGFDGLTRGFDGSQPYWSNVPLVRSILV